VSGDREIEILDLAGDVRALIAECEVMGNRTRFLRNSRPVAVLVSHDEYLALRETVEIVKDGQVLTNVMAAEEQVKRGAMLMVEDLFGKG
jgi:PHD/YefM family antitoxin component YafN of YafNO toxin-antitoxin module